MSHQQNVAQLVVQITFLVSLAALSVLQNGNIPKFMGPEVLTEVFESTEPSMCIRNLRNGLDSLGIMQVHVYIHIQDSLCENKAANIVAF